MQRQMLKSKIHRARVVDRNPDYAGSITIDRQLLTDARLLEHEQVHVWDVTNGSRFVTYAIAGDLGWGEVVVNGAAAWLVREQDVVIVASFASCDEQELASHAPVIVQVEAEASDDPRLLSPPRAWLG